MYIYIFLVVTFGQASTPGRVHILVVFQHVCMYYMCTVSDGFMHRHYLYRTTGVAPRCIGRCRFDIFEGWLACTYRPRPRRAHANKRSSTSRRVQLAYLELYDAPCTNECVGINTCHDYVDIRNTLARIYHAPTPNPSLTVYHLPRYLETSRVSTVSIALAPGNILVDTISDATAAARTWKRSLAMV